mmetsp:Transcript_139135/g.266812  ORF Transcript_139135/g.266812 Transcript_139135/m.266812 type:complete len:103 (+) Transcript_139135:1-309(+)
MSTIEANKVFINDADHSRFINHELGVDGLGCWFGPPVFASRSAPARSSAHGGAGEAQKQPLELQPHSYAGFQFPRRDIRTGPHTGSAQQEKDKSDREAECLE